MLWLLTLSAGIIGMYSTPSFVFHETFVSCLSSLDISVLFCKLSYYTWDCSQMYHICSIIHTYANHVFVLYFIFSDYQCIFSCNPEHRTLKFICVTCPFSMGITGWFAESQCWADREKMLLGSSIWKGKSLCSKSSYPFGKLTDVIGMGSNLKQEFPKLFNFYVGL